ncbi:golgin subfamily A member 8S-like isoform X2 [Trachypithecus francoisi]|uniref:golgin subfamily A member 8S-like isoform X2 n=1 Tax=Trachypithecus francoisi TaxID=54180 RepID=UPI00141BB3C2|nr:golgin subfamily A member 8S-like isoform X2 [Trachypithecus francoisi]
MLEETRERKLAAAKKKLKEHWQRNSPGAPAGVNKNRKTNGSSPETATSGGCHSTGDSATGIHREGPTSSAPLKDLESRSQELAAVLDSRPVKISLLKNTIKSLKQEKKQVEHQLEEEKKANSEKQKAERKLEVQVQRLNIQKGKLSTHLYHQKRSLRYLEEESKDLAGRLQHSLQHKGELKRALSAITTTQKKDDRSSSHRKAHMEWKLEWSIREQALLKAQLTQMKYSLKQVQLERDEYAQHLKGERARWQERMRKMLQEVCTLKKEKKDVTHWVEKLERSLSKLKNQTAEPLPREPPAVPPEEELQHLRKELERVSAELQAQVENHQHNNENKSALQLEQQVEELQEKLGKEHLEAASQQNQQLTAQLRLMALPGEEDGGGHLDSEKEEAPQPMPSVPEDLEIWEAMSGFMGHREEMADLSELVKKQELRFIHYRRERCHQNVHHLTIEAGGSAKDAAMGGGHHQAGPAQGGDEGESAGAAGDAVTACADHNSEHSKLLTSAQNPADEPGPGAPAPQELGAAKQHGDLCEVSLTDSSEPVQGEAREGSPYDNPTAQPIMQDHQEHPGLGSNCFVPFLSCAWLRRRRR